MPDLQDGESVEMKGSGAKPYILKNTGGVYSCSCPAWRNQSEPIERRTCKHLRRLRGDAAEEARLGGALPQKPAARTAGDDDATDEPGKAGPPLLLAQPWDNATDLSGWWMSEKLDGVRAYWDGRQFLSRLGNLYHAPDWFIDGMPDVPLDGELWIGRKRFQRTVSVVRRQDKSDLWSEVRFLAFDAPTAGGPFEERIGFVRDTLARRSLRYAMAHEHRLCNDLASLQKELARIEGLGGEGLMLRQPGSAYETGRSSTLLKVKSFHDAEAVVIGHQAGAGRHRGRLGALMVRLPSGIEFSVGTGFSDREREDPPGVGATVTFRYQELSEGGVPRFPSYVGIRHDAPAAIPGDRPASASPAPRAGAAISISGESVPPTPAASSGPRYFEFTQGKSNKFWAVCRSGCQVTTRWGRIGTAGQEKARAFADDSAAARHVEKLIAEKSGEGYVEKTEIPV
jgi:DNA ligase-1